MDIELVYDDIQKLVNENTKLKNKNNYLNGKLNDYKNKIDNMNLIILARDEDLAKIIGLKDKLEKDYVVLCEETRILGLKYNARNEDLDTMFGVKDKLDAQLNVKNNEIAELKRSNKLANERINLLENYVDCVVSEKYDLNRKICEQDMKVIKLYVGFICCLVFYGIFVFINDIELYLM